MEASVVEPESSTHGAVSQLAVVGIVVAHPWHGWVELLDDEVCA